MKGDQFWGPMLPERPKVIFRRAQTLRDIVSPNIVARPIQPVMFGILK